MRRLDESQLENDFEREYCWGDDERHLFNPKKRRASVMGYLMRINAILEAVEKYAPGKRVADFASAQGNIGLQLAERGFDVTAVDIKPEFLKYAEKKHTHGQFKTVLANIIEYRASEPYDCIVLGEVIEHVAFPDQLLKAVNANLKPGGILVLSTPNGGEHGSPLPTYTQVTNIEELIPRQFHWGDHLFLYTDRELEDLCKQTGFQLLDLEKMNSQFVSQMKAIRYLFPLKTLMWMEKKARSKKREGKDTTCTLVVVARKL